MSDEKRVKLEGLSDSDHFYSYAKIMENGAVKVGAVDAGNAAQTMMGGEYEYWVTVPASSKDDLILSLINKCFGNEKSPADAFHEFVKREGLDNKFENWVSFDD